MKPYEDWTPEYIKLVGEVACLPGITTNDIRRALGLEPSHYNLMLNLPHVCDEEAE